MVVVWEELQSIFNIIVPNAKVLKVIIEDTQHRCENIKMWWMQNWKNNIKVATKIINIKVRQKNLISQNWGNNGKNNNKRNQHRTENMKEIWWMQIKEINNLNKDFFVKFLH
jgi:hypothetical protein